MQNTLVDGVLWYVVFLFSTICHEAAHAWTALKLGDDTASRGGQVSLNPSPHIRREPIGMVVVPLISYFAAGWMMGWASAPYNLSWARQFPRRAALMAIAGPASNLGLVILAGLLLRVGVEWDVFSAPHAISFSQLVTVTGSEAFDLPAKLLSIFFSLNLLLCVFNLLPVPPLDGSAVPLIALPTAAARGYFDLLQSPMLRLVGFLLITRGLGSFFQPILAWAVGLVHPGMRYG